jgi:PIN domain nuclease of toxin-antitoxin system
LNLLLDTHLLLWAAGHPDRLSETARTLIIDENNSLFFSAASVWEIVIKSGLGRNDFRVDPDLFRRSLQDNGYLELPIMSQHVLAVSHLPDLHKDPFDRMLVAQAQSEGFLLLTTDERVALYPGPVQQV